MNVKKSVISLCVISVMMGAAWETAVAMQAEQDDDSVKRWGRWAVLSPAAGQEEARLTTIASANDLGSCESSVNCPGIQPVGEPVEPPPPIKPPPSPSPEVKSPCEAGMPCGFTRVDYAYDAAGENAPAESNVVPFALTLDEDGGTVAFVVDPGTEGEIQSDTVPALIRPELVTTYRGSPDDLRGPITRDEAGEPVLVQGPWRHTDYDDNENLVVNGGEYVWGVTATADQMQSLISGLGADTIAVFEGKTMGVTNGNEGVVRMEVNFDAASWTGQFNNHAFTASGDVIGSGFVSDANGFSDNIASGVVKGGFVNAGRNAIGGYQVTDVQGIKSADVFSAGLRNERVY